MSIRILDDYDFQGVNRPTNIPSPVNPGDAANMAYVDSVIEGISWKDDVRVMSQGNINLSSPGAVIDGVTMAVGDRVLVPNQTTQSQNGIYVWSGASTPMTRSLDASTFAELRQAVVPVAEGTAAGTQWRQTQVNGTIDVDPILWVNSNTSAPPASETAAGIAEIATQAETNAGTDDTRIVTPQKLANWSGRRRVVAANIGDGSATQFIVTHNFNTFDVLWDVYANSGIRDSVEPTVDRPSVNAIRITCNPAPAINEYRVVIMG